MPAMPTWCQLIGIAPKAISHEEFAILEAEIFYRIYVELQESLRSQYKNYFRVMRFNSQKEDKMLDSNFLRYIINDIIASNEYDMKGIANYANMHVEVIEEVVCGFNTHPSAYLFQKIIGLHRSVRHELYKSILKKISHEYSHLQTVNH